MAGITAILLTSQQNVINLYWLPMSDTLNPRVYMLRILPD
ncbi:Uncharacterised protein [Serratia quinivorans]|nr:Uncharacterised protein [Serratia quinivorans]